MRYSSAAALGLALLLVASVPASAQQTPQPCRLIRQFKRLHDLTPLIVGDCTSRRVFAPNGDILQYTVNGLIVHRQSDNWTAFTDGHQTFIEGPNGLVSRSNDERFPWEHDASASLLDSGAPPSPRLGPATAYPDPRLTPGTADPRITQRYLERTVCSADYASKVRATPSYAQRVMRRQMARYHYQDTDPDHYRLDYVIPIELGGDPDAPSNMWPQPLSPAPAAAEKDRVTAYLRQQVCSGAMTLAAAQQAVQNDWVAVYEQLPPGYGENGGP